MVNFGLVVVSGVPGYGCKTEADTRDRYIED
jgi:hypothetical protein